MNNDGYLLGYDVGSTFVKTSLLEIETGDFVASATSPEKELEIMITEEGWAEQHPHIWWEHIKRATAILKEQVGKKLDDVRAIGISYQMNGLVIVDKNYEALRPSILSSDNRAVKIGEQALNSLGEELCLLHMLNSPVNSTASKLRWIMENEYDIYKRIFKFMLPGDYIGMLMTGEILTTPSGLSEGIMWDFPNDKISEVILKHYNISHDLIPTVVPNLFDHGVLTSKAASELGLREGIKVSYRAGDKLNGAFSLNVLHPNEFSVTVGNSGVMYGITNKLVGDSRFRSNTFVHVNHQKSHPSYGVIVNIYGISILNSWLKRNIVTFGSDTLTYNQMNKLAELIPAASEGLVVLPYSISAEQTLDSKSIGVAICKLDMEIHSKAHILRAGQEGIAFALKQGLEIMTGLGIELKDIRANLSDIFLSSLFCEALSTVTDTNIKLYNTDSAQGAARGAGVGSGVYNSFDEAFIGLKIAKVIEPNSKKRETYLEAYLKWYQVLKKFL